MNTLPPRVKVLFFDVFGTCVEQRRSVAEELWNAAKEALASSDSLISKEVREKATEMSYEDWFDFGGQWNKESDKFVKSSIDEHGTVDWEKVDGNRVSLLPKMLAERGLIIFRKDDDNLDNHVEDGSLWTSSKLDHLGTIWHRLPPWPDTCRGLGVLNKKFTTVTLSNTYNDLLQGLIKHAETPFKHIISADMFQSFKPNPKVYLGAAESLGVKPEECALVASHLFDLKAAKACGFYVISVVRPLEEKNPELRVEGIPDMVIAEGENGFIELAKRLGMSV